jgi:hypothetical protein
MMNYRGLYVLMVALILVAAGCGSGSRHATTRARQAGESTGAAEAPPHKQLSQAEFKRYGQDVCTTAAKHLSGRRGTGAAGVIEFALAFADAKAKGIGALRPPPSLRHEYDQYLRTLIDRRRVLDHAQSLIHANVTKATRLYVGSAASLRITEDRYASAVGLRRCMANPRPELHPELP